MTTPPLPNALSLEEWRLALLWARGKMPGGKVRGMVVLDLPESHKHGAAALALHGQPFGFTHADLAFLRDIPKMVEDRTMTDEDERRAASLAARIDALLPPLDATALQP